LGLATGVVSVRNSCLYLGNDLLVWPSTYTLTGGNDIRIIGDGFAIRPGDTIEIGGGEYQELSTLPSGIIGPAPPCHGPYVWVAKTTAASGAAP
jgi:hypothetical protein